MHHPTLAGPRRRTRRALLAAALPAALAAVALPSAAQAASVSDVPIGSGKRAVLVFDRSFTGGSTEANDVTVRAEPISSGSLIVVTDRAGVTADGGSCFRFSATEARCPVPSDAEVDVNLAGGDDRMQYQARHRGTVGLGSGSDALLAGTRELNGAGGLLEPVSYGGGTGTDTINYINADRGVRLTPEDGLANDGRLIDRDNVGADFETIIGSNFADAPLFGTPNADTMFGAGGNDQIAGGKGDDVFFSGIADGADDYRGGDGLNDRIEYDGRTQPLTVDIDGVADDGQAGENDNVHGDVETLVGGSAADVLIGSSGADRLIGGLGNDRLDGLTGNDRFIMGNAADGGDRVTGGPGNDTVDYGKRTRPINATLNHDGADDGEAGEGDELVGANEIIIGGTAGDTIRAPDGSKAAHQLFGGRGIDTLEGADGPDTIDAGTGGDTVIAEGADDTVFAADGEGDIVGCGPGTDDTAELDPNTVDVSSSCENRSVVGTLRLAPTRLQAKAGETARLRLSWRHPQGWRKLRAIELRLTRDEAPVGEITIHPRSGRISDRGAVEVMRSRTRLTRKGKTVAARLAVRLDESLAGQTLNADVEATDRRGGRQLERNAGTVRVAG